VASGDIDGAIASFRQAAYLDPDDPITHLHLGLALESGRHQRAALRAFAAARGALERAEPATWGDSLEGFDTAELAGLLDEKLRGVR
jgi:Flp pilus assembly protein TadD